MTLHPKTRTEVMGGVWEKDCRDMMRADKSTMVQPVVKKLVKATGAENYNVLQNNGRIAHQDVDHVSLSGCIWGHCGDDADWSC